MSFLSTIKGWFSSEAPLKIVKEKKQRTHKVENTPPSPPPIDDVVNPPEVPDDQQ